MHGRMPVIRCSDFRVMQKLPGLIFIIVGAFGMATYLSSGAFVTTDEKITMLLGFVMIIIGVIIFTPVFRGRIIDDTPELDVFRIGRTGFMIAGKQAGPFRLEIGWVKAYA
jgi:hypothetical protein